MGLERYVFRPASFAFINTSHKLGCDTATRAEGAETEADVRITTGTTGAANVQHGVCCDDDGEPAEHYGHSGRNDGGDQGNEETVRED